MLYMKYLNKILQKIKYKFLTKIFFHLEEIKLLNGKILSNQIQSMNSIKSLSDVEFSVFSQFGDDGIIQYLIHNLDLPNKTFIEFGVEDFTESNTRFLMINNNYKGFVMDGDKKNIDRIKLQYYYWKYDLTAKAKFINRKNINELINQQNFDKDVGVLHIDLDGNDFYIWQEINVIEPIIVIVEYNSVFGKDRAISVPYNKNFVRNVAHYSNLFFGASLKSFYELAKRKGYSFIGCNSAGNNAYFIRNDKLNNNVKAVSIDDGFVEEKFRQSRDKDGNLTFISGKEKANILLGLEVMNTITNTIEKF
jgi:hypothetical protein